VWSINFSPSYYNYSFFSYFLLLSFFLRFSFFRSEGWARKREGGREGKKGIERYPTLWRKGIEGYPTSRQGGEMERTKEGRRR
jgi:hypothetical protein